MKEGHDIYIGPDDSLTDVRKRLEQVPTLTRNVTLIFDRQTQLRNPTDWKNLHAYARNQGKDVFIISPDPRTRAMAKDARFQVVDALDSPSTAKLQAGKSHSVRKNQTGKGKAAQRPTQNRGSERTSNVSAGNMSAGRITDLNPAREKGQRPNPIISSSVERNSSPLIEDMSISDQDGPISPLYEEHASHYSQAYDYEIEAEHYIRPLSPQEIEEEPDALLADVPQAESIRQAAREGREKQSPQWSDVPVVPSHRSQPLSQAGLVSRITPLSDPEGDPFAYLDDPAPASLAEQHGSVFVDRMDTSEQSIPDIADLPTDIIDVNGDIEYDRELSGQGDVIEADPPARSWSATALHEDEIPPYEEPQRVYGMRPRGSRSGKMVPRTPREDEGRQEETLFPIEDRPTQVIPPPVPLPRPVEPAARAGTAAPNTPVPGRANAGRATQQPAATGRQPALTKPQTRQPQGARGTQSNQSRQRPTETNRSAGNRAVTGNMRTTQGKRAKPTRQEIRGSAVLVGIAVLLLIVVGLLAFLIPSATVTLTLTSRDFSASNLKLIAQPGKTAGVAGVVPATVLSQTFPTNGEPETGTGSVTGNSPTGTAQAIGIVTFTNSGTTAITIPSSTVVATANGVQFATTANAVVNVSNSNAGNTIPVPVQAQQPGEVGNVPANSVTVIPASSLSVIAQANNVQANALKLSVSNVSTFTGGGTGTTSSVTQADLTKEQQALQAQLQGAIDTWLKQSIHSGDATGTPVITAKNASAPAVGTTEESGTFKMSASFVVQVLVARSADIQQAARVLLNGALQQNAAYKGKGYVIATDAAHPVQFSQLKQTANDLTSLTLAFNAIGKVVPNLPASQVQSLVVGKSKSEAQSVLLAVPGVQAVSIQTSPGFVTWVPFLASHIAVSYAAGTQTTPGAKPTATPTKTK